MMGKRTVVFEQQRRGDFVETFWLFALGDRSLRPSGASQLDGNHATTQRAIIVDTLYIIPTRLKHVQSSPLPLTVSPFSLPQTS